MSSAIRLLDQPLYQTYKAEIGDWLAEMYEPDFSKRSLDLGYQVTASAVFSANIEGNTIDLNAFMNMRLAQTKFKPSKEIVEIEDLIAAYEYAQHHPLTEGRMLQAHAQLAKNLVYDFQQGVYRQTKAGVFSPQGLVYLAVEPEFVSREIGNLFAEIAHLLARSLSLAEIFYFAALIHVRFVHIHPFVDGNGRTARLLEKWFLAHHLGKNAWKIPTEQCYKQHQADYYQALNLGGDYYNLDYDQLLPFLLLLPRALAL